MEELFKIFDELSARADSDNIDLPMALLFQTATQIYLFREGEKNKDTRTSQIAKREDEVSEKQRNVLIKFGYKGDINSLTKKQATEIIGKFFDKDKAKKDREEEFKEEQY